MADTYPKRPKFFALRFCRVMAKVCLANEIGPDGCWLLAIIANTEDAKGYRDAVTYFNGQLMPLVGCKSDEALNRLRVKATAAGWLHYQAGGKGKPGRYWVIVPEQHCDWDDAPSDETRGELATGPAEGSDYSPAKQRGEARDNRGRSEGQPREKRGTTEGEARDNRGTTAEHSSLSLSLSPDLSRSQRQTDPQTPIASAPAPEPEPFDPLRAEQADRKLFEQRWADAGLRKFSRLSPSHQTRLVGLLLDPWWAEHYPAALERAGRIPWLRDGMGRQRGPYDVSEFLRDPDECRKIIDGVYDPRAPTAPTTTTGPPGPAPKPAKETPEELVARLRRENAPKPPTSTQEPACTTPSNAPTGTPAGSPATAKPSAPAPS